MYGGREKGINVKSNLHVVKCLSSPDYILHEIDKRGQEVKKERNIEKLHMRFKEHQFGYW